MARARAAIACTIFDSLGRSGAGSSMNSLIQHSAAVEVDSGSPFSSNTTTPGPQSTKCPPGGAWVAMARRRPVAMEADSADSALTSASVNHGWSG